MPVYSCIVTAGVHGDITGSQLTEEHAMRRQARGMGVEFEWGYDALSASEAIFRATTYSRITYSVR